MSWYLPAAPTWLEHLSTCGNQGSCKMTEAHRILAETPSVNFTNSERCIFSRLVIFFTSQTRYKCHLLLNTEKMSSAQLPNFNNLKCLLLVYACVWHKLYARTNKVKTNPGYIVIIQLFLRWQSLNQYLPNGIPCKYFTPFTLLFLGHLIVWIF